MPTSIGNLLDRTCTMISDKRSSFTEINKITLIELKASITSGVGYCDYKFKTPTICCLQNEQKYWNTNQ